MLDFATQFQAEEHQPFLYKNGKAAALLVHGFPGTPAELRPLAYTLHEQDWTVQGLLLPGFGPQINQLVTYTMSNWVTAILGAMAELKKEHSPVILIGHSMGAALAVQVATRIQPDALVLLAPFWKLGDTWTDAAWPVLRRLFTEIRPFRLVSPDFNDPEFRQEINKFMPGLDLDDPVTRQNMRDFRFPTRVLDQLWQAGQHGYRALRQLPPALPILVLQGTADDLVQPARTRRWVQALPGPITYREMAGDHNLLDPQQPEWAYIITAVHTFLNRHLTDHS